MTVEERICETDMSFKSGVKTEGVTDGENEDDDCDESCAG